MNITLAELIAEYDRLVQQEPDAKGFTTREWAKEWGVSLEITRERIRYALDQGLLKLMGNKMIRRMDNRITRVPCFGLANPKSKKKR